MGIIWSRFRKKESTKEKLQKIQEEITNLEEYKEHTEQRRKKLVGSFIAFNILVIFVAAIVFYFYYLPPTWTECFLKATPFAGFILLIYLIKTLLTCYYRWKVRRNENKLVSLKLKKEQILDDVMETETYKVAKEILETYAPEKFSRAAMSFKSPVVTSAVSSHRMPIQQSGELRRRIVSPQYSQSFNPRATPASLRPAGPSRPYPYTRPSPTPLSQSGIAPRPIGKDVSSSSFSSLQGHRVAYSSATPLTAPFFTPRTDGNALMPVSSGSVSETPGRPMPRPILPRERGLLERFVEYLVGDGPSNRYALVCRQCESHNGMALKEEFPYIAFRCAYCFYWNPARKQKPSAPKLESPPQRVSLEMTRKLLENEEEEESSLEEDGDEEESDTDSSTSSGPSSDNEGDTVSRFINTSSPDARVKGTKRKEEAKEETGELTTEDKNPVESSSSEPVSKSGHESVESSTTSEQNPGCESPHAPPAEGLAETL